jgi:hypothetical protein
VNKSKAISPMPVKAAIVSAFHHSARMEEANGNPPQVYMYIVQSAGDQ